MLIAEYFADLVRQIEHSPVVSTQSVTLDARSEYPDTEVVIASPERFLSDILDEIEQHVYHTSGV
jgi:hypothetical protein